MSETRGPDSLPAPAGRKLSVDEELLRGCVLDSYMRHDRGDRFEQAVIRSISKFLSGPLEKESASELYWFEEHPESSAKDFARELDALRPGLARAIVEPLTQAIEDRPQPDPVELAPNVSIWIASLAGALAVRAEIDESLAAGLLAAVLLAFERLGSRQAAAFLATDGTTGTSSQESS